MAVAMRWGTWEELVLGGAVLRHGTNDWDAVASELRARTLSPHLFTPQECEAKYVNVQEQYSGSGCDAWLEELRKRRVAELKRELEKSEDSIGSLQSKLESLTSERESNSNTSRAESTNPTEDGDGINSSSKEVSKDGSSAGSFTEKTTRECSPECQNLASISAQGNDLRIQSSKDSEKDKAGCIYSEIGFGNFKRKRGKRMRKGSTAVKEGSVGDTDTMSSAATMDGEGSSKGCNHHTKFICDNYDGILRDVDTNLDLEELMDSIVDHKDVLIFQRRLESQKRARYKKMIRRHVDFQNITSRIGSGSISSAKELFRDLLLLSNNALVFYPKNSTEHKSALILRDLSSRKLRQRSWNPTRSSNDHVSAVPDGSKPRKIKRPSNNSSISRNEATASTGDGSPVTGSVKKSSRAEVAVKSPGRKRLTGRPAKSGKRGGKKRQESPNKGKKRARR